MPGRSLLVGFSRPFHDLRRVKVVWVFGKKIVLRRLKQSDQSATISSSGGTAAQIDAH